MRAMACALLLTGCPGEEPPCFEGEATFGEIQTKIFDVSCNNFSTCHNTTAGNSVANLDLCTPSSPADDCEFDDSDPYETLVGVEASCRVGSRSEEDPFCVVGETIRVVPGDPEASYLYRRVSGEGLGPDVRKMPYGSTDGLCAEGVDAIRTWIENGAER